MILLRTIKISLLLVVPSEAPQDITARNTSATSILVEWGSVRASKRNGIVRGYKVSYTKNGETETIELNDGNAKKLEVTGLDVYTEYSVKVLAFTSVGDGPESSPLTVTSDESSKKLNTFYFVQLSFYVSFSLV